MQQKKYSIISAVHFCFRYSIKTSSLKLLIEILSGILMPLMVLFVAYFIDNALSLAEDDAPLATLIFALVIMTAYYTYLQVSHIVIRLADKSLENALRENLRPQLIHKQSLVPFVLLEDAKTLDLITYVCSNAEIQMMSIFSNCIGIIKIFIQVSGTLFLLLKYIWWILPLFLLSFILIAYIAHKGGQAIYNSDKITTKLTRTHYYLSSILVSRETAAERTLFGYTDNINKKFSAAHLKRSNMVTKEIAVEEISINLCGLILNILVLITVFSLLSPVKSKTMTHGLYVSLIGALIGLVRMITGSVSRLISDVTGHIEYMKDYSSFFALPEDEDNENKSNENEGNENQDNEELDKKNKASFSSLRICNLRFRYTLESHYVLDGVNLFLEKGKSYSLIGPNGAGKSTLTKILLGLYRDFEGNIYINGVDIAEYSTYELQKLFSIVYQDYAKYYISFKDNITLCKNIENFKHSVQSAELTDIISKLPNGENTLLGKIYDNGIDISGGEWQKIAIARALNADTPFIILDEPTASLSPMMESKLYMRFSEITKGKTSLLISHRLGSTKLSDVLFVLDNGIIAETGTHDELMAINGIYADMFASQRSWYDER